MNDFDRLQVLLYEMLMHLEIEIDEEVENRQRMLLQMPTPVTAEAYRDALLRAETFKDFMRRFRSVLDFFRKDGV